ncbi:hypothetical protein P0W64_21495 [Tsukamurella sp. 8F]|uniref:hypothetical protein n=1 Tax=unclassified Tsukamurella TaxID=2633480 RepID=UPI0023B996CD|nr:MULTISPECIES: hypothetical protein [unclassified Tsukamurella]MDF0529451.1 hypothetical protein [Tsukamurella sp. 8J]MDF0589360.1 hypothetical protein [Tsukamurella sp. 8F]
MTEDAAFVEGCASETAIIEVAVRPARLSGRMLRAYSDPYVAIDGTEIPVDWQMPHAFDVAPGTHQVAAFAPPRGLMGRLNRRLGGSGGRGTLRVNVRPGERVHVLARYGDAASDRFLLTEVDGL